MGVLKREAPVLDTEALRVEQLVEGMTYTCHLSRNVVLYLGKGTVKWWCSGTLAYKTDKVGEYQLIPRSHE